MLKGKKFVTTAQLSEKLGGRSRTSLFRDVKLNRLPAPVKIGQRNYFDEQQVDDFLTAPSNAA